MTSSSIARLSSRPNPSEARWGPFSRRRWHRKGVAREYVGNERIDAAQGAALTLTTSACSRLARFS